jgi:hypothetical protein
MLVLQCSLNIPVPHRSHDSREVPGSLENSRPVIVPAAIKNEILREAGFSSGFPKPVRHRCEVYALRSLRWKDPACAFCAAPRFEDAERTTAHRYPSSSLCCLAVRNENDAPFPIQVLDAHPVKFSFVSHPGVAHQNHDVLEKAASFGSASCTRRPPPIVSVPRPRRASANVRTLFSTSILEHAESVSTPLPCEAFFSRFSERN